MPNPSRRFAAGPTRDALGLVRLLWTIENDSLDFDRINAITDAGEMLVRALQLGRSPGDSNDHRAALEWSARAVDKLTALGWSPEYGELVQRASYRVRGETPRGEDDRDVKRRIHAARG